MIHAFFEQATQAASAATNTGGSYSPLLITFFVLGGIFAFLFLAFVICQLFVFPILRKKKMEKDEETKLALLKKIKPGDEVLLASGIFGEVTEKQGQIYFIKIADKTVVKVNRNYIIGYFNEKIAQEVHANKKGK